MRVSKITQNICAFALFGYALTPGVASAVGLKEKLTFTGDQSGVTSLVYNLKGSRLFSGGWENSIKQWDPRNGRLLSTIDHSGFGDLILDLDISRDGRQLVTGSRDYERRKFTVKLWNIKSGKAGVDLRTPVPNFCDSVRFNPNGKQVAAGCWDSQKGKRTLQIWNLRNGKVVLTKNGLSGPVAYGPKGRVMTGGDAHAFTLNTLDSRSGKVIRTLSGQSVLSARYSLNGSRVLTGAANGDVTIWNAKRGSKIDTLSGHTDLVNDVAYSADGNYIISGSKDNTLRLWRGNKAEPLHTVTLNDPIEAIAVAPRGRTVAVASGTSIHIFEIDHSMTGNTAGNTNAGGPPSGPPSSNKTSIQGKWRGPNGENFDLRQRGSSITIRENSNTLATVQIRGDTINWDGVRGKVRGNTINWSNGTKWTRRSGQSGPPSGSASGPPSSNKSSVQGKWRGPNGENFDLRQRGSSITIRENSNTLATVQIRGDTINWDGVRGKVRGNTINWSNGTKWTRRSGQSGPPSGSAGGPPSSNKTGFQGKWIGPNGENYDLRQRGSSITIRENSNTLATVQIRGNTITWGQVKGTLRGNSISWTNNTRWTRKNGSSSNASVSRHVDVTCKSKWFLFWECGHPTAKTVELIKQHSVVVCAEGDSYGLNAQGLWVDKGCNADFRLGLE